MKKCFLGLGLLAALLVAGVTAQATHYGRQYYSGWTYYPQRSYYYRSYYYKPTPTYTDYKYHYTVYYPTQPRYVYYYNPYTNAYWGRFDLESKDEKQQYSLLAEKDRKKDLKDIPESAFPAPAAMPPIPESDGKEPILAPPRDVPK